MTKYEIKLERNDRGELGETFATIEAESASAALELAVDRFARVGYVGSPLEGRNRAPGYYQVWLAVGEYLGGGHYADSATRKVS